jgi:nitroreductase
VDNRLQWIFKRRSIRKYKDIPVEQDKIEAMLQAAMAAPSAGNRQPWHFVVVTDRASLDKIAEIHPYAKMLNEATLCICVCGEPASSLGNEQRKYWVQDCSAAMQNLLLAAASLDLGSVWLGLHPNPQREEEVRAFLNLPPNITPLGLAAIGYPDEEKPGQTRYAQDKVHYHQFGGETPNCPIG